MDIRLYGRKFIGHWRKRAFKRKQKTYEDWLAKIYQSTAC